MSVNSVRPPSRTLHGGGRGWKGHARLSLTDLKPASSHTRRDFRMGRHTVARNAAAYHHCYLLTAADTEVKLTRIKVITCGFAYLSWLEQLLLTRRGASFRHLNKTGSPCGLDGRYKIRVCVKRKCVCTVTCTLSPLWRLGRDAVSLISQHLHNVLLQWVQWVQCSVLSKAAEMRRCIIS